MVNAKIDMVNDKYAAHVSVNIFLNFPYFCEENNAKQGCACMTCYRLLV